MRVLTDKEIAAFINEKKPLPSNWRYRLQPRGSRFGAHRARDMQVEGENGNLFRIIVRENPNLLNDFSVILMYYDQETTARWRLRRYNGNGSHMHTNIIEHRNGVPGSRFDKEFHIHICTERYQAEGHKEDHYAEVTDRYSDIDGALSCLIEDCGFEYEGPIEENQGQLF